MIRTASALAAALAILAASANAREPLSLAPDDTEVVIVANINDVANTPLAVRLMEKLGGDQLRAGIDVVKNLTGVSPLEDLERLGVFARVDDDESAVVTVEGAFEQDRLVALVRLNKQYAAKTTSGATVHQWYDENEGRTKFASFIEADLLVITNSSDRMARMIEQTRTGAGSLAANPGVLPVPAGAGTAAAWGFIVRPDRESDAADAGRALAITAANMVMNVADAHVDLTVATISEDEPTAAQWHDVAKGAHSFFNLQRAEEIPRELAKRTTLAPREGREVRATLRLSEADLLELAEKAR
ncbi:MAG: hypothetical protein SF028_08825 [Candidatus Sumerlaeia bacterium]|nr:hypothetical protein [Candidatus Sumerlaeia bacterium]